MARGLMGWMWMVAVAVAVGAAPARAEEALRFGVAHAVSRDRAEQAARAIEGYFGAALRRPVAGVVYDTYDQLAGALAGGQVDMAWITPLSFVRASRQSKAPLVPLAKAIRKGLSYRSVLFTRAEAGVTELSQLRGLRVAWVDPGSAAGYLFPRALLLKQGLPLAGFFARETFAGDHGGVCRSVLAGDTDVGAVFSNAVEPQFARPDACVESGVVGTTDGLKVLAVTDRIPNEVIVGRAGFDEELALSVTGILAGLPSTESGREVLQSIFAADGFGLALESDFEPVRRIVEAVDSGKWAAPAAAPVAAEGGSKAVPAGAKGSKSSKAVRKGR